MRPSFHLRNWLLDYNEFPVSCLVIDYAGTLLSGPEGVNAFSQWCPRLGATWHYLQGSRSAGLRPAATAASPDALARANQPLPPLHAAAGHSPALRWRVRLRPIHAAAATSRRRRLGPR